MTIRLFTPGHGDPLDTLILNGLVFSIIEEYPDYELEVLKQGNRSILLIKGDKIDEKKVIENAYNSIVYDYESSISKLNYIALQFSSKKFKEKINKVYNKIKENSNELFIKSFSNEFHAIKLKEGRGKESNKFSKVYIQIAPFTGSFLKMPFVCVGTTGHASFHAKESDYVICNLCFLFAWTGLIKSTTVIKHSDKRKRRVLLITPTAIRANDKDIAMLGFIFGEKVESISTDIPPLAGILYTLSSGETIKAVSEQSVFEILYWNISMEGNFPSIKNASSIPLSNIYRFISEAKIKSTKLVKFIETVLGIKSGEGEPELIQLLAESIIYAKYDSYNVIRNIWSYLEKSNSYLLDEGILDSLRKVII